jgi:hypothetical protein
VSVPEIIADARQIYDITGDVDINQARAGHRGHRRGAAKPASSLGCAIAGDPPGPGRDDAQRTSVAGIRSRLPAGGTSPGLGILLLLPAEAYKRIEK